MTDDQVLAYVKATACALDMSLDDARAGRVAANLQRTFAMAQLLEQYDLTPHDEPAEIYCPAPFRFTSDGEDAL